MKATPVCHRFGQDMEQRSLDAMPRNTASGIGNCTAVIWSGLAWYRPQGLFQQNLIHRTEGLRKAA
jgi:hypothetical protein